MSSKTIPISTSSNNNEWVQYYQEAFMEEVEPATQGFSGSPVRSQPTSRGGPGPAPAPTTKPVRRRSRASKKTPTTLLNANANNFRALVQQFTGCPTPISLANQKGPLNLNFGLKNATPMADPFRNRYDYPQTAVNRTLINDQLEQQQYQVQQSYGHMGQDHDQDQQYNSFFNTMNGDVFFPSTSMNAATPTTTVMENISNSGFFIEDDHFPMHHHDFTTPSAFLFDS